MEAAGDPSPVSVPFCGIPKKGDKACRMLWPPWLSFAVEEGRGWLVLHVLLKCFFLFASQLLL